jgi:hypothetical protein
VSTGRLWPAAAGQGLLRVSSAGNSEPLPAVDPFVGFTGLTSPGLAGPGTSPQSIVRARWVGEVEAPRDGLYQLDVRAGGRARLSIDAQPLEVGCPGSEGKPTSLQLQLAAGWHPLQLDYVSAPGTVLAELYWAPPGEPRVLVPSDRLRYAAAEQAASAAPPSPPLGIDCAVP